MNSSRVARIAIFSTLCVIGSFIHLPSPISTVAFDSWPGFFSALYFGAIDGALIAGIGHIATSIINGFPLGILHLFIAIGMGFVGWMIGVVNRILKNQKFGFIIALICGIAINTMLFVIAVPVIGWLNAIAFVPFLLIAASLNGLVAGFAYVGLKSRAIKR